MRMTGVASRADEEGTGWVREDDRRYRPHAWIDQHSPQRRDAPVRRGLSPDFRVFPSKRAIFDVLVERWREAATYESLSHRVAMLPAYQEMIGIGPEAIPFILDRLRADPSPHWFWALRAIAHEDAAAGSSTVQDAVDAWLEWGRSTSSGSG